MSDLRLRDLGVRVEEATPVHDFDDLVRRAHRRVTARRVGTLAVGGIVVAAAVFAVARVGETDRRTSPPPVDRVDQGRVMWCPEDRDPECFDLGGRLVYSGRSSGLWAVDPTRPAAPDNPLQLSDEGSETPLEWSSDGMRLLVRRLSPATPKQGGLVVLSPDGTENRVVERDGYGLDGSFSPDGSQVVYAWYGSGGIYTVDLDGGTPHLLLAPASRPYPGEETEFKGELYNPVFSPDGTQIAYFDGMGDWGHSLRVMSADGADVLTLVDGWGASHVDDLAWSPDGHHLMFAFAEGEGGIWTIGVDGSGLTQLDPDGVNPSWSPDGTQIAYQRGQAGPLRIVDLAGEDLAEFDYGGSGPWNPLPADR